MIRLFSFVLFRPHDYIYFGRTIIFKTKHLTIQKTVYSSVSISRIIFNNKFSGKDQKIRLNLI